MTCKNEECVIDAIKNNFCKEHYIEAKQAEYLDNTNPNDLGIVKWIKDMFPVGAENSTPEMHIHLYLCLLNLYNPIYMNKMHRLFENINFRGSAKSTIVRCSFLLF